MATPPVHRYRDSPSGWDRQAGRRHLIHVDPQPAGALEFSQSVAQGLESVPRWLSCTYLYDRRGSQLFEAITKQPEYYQTRTENQLLTASARAIREHVGETTLVELGSGSSEKTRHLLEAWTREGPTHYIPIDVSLSALESACHDLEGLFPGLAVEGFACTYQKAIPLLHPHSPLLLVFLGSTIGNFNPAEMDQFLSLLASHLRPGDFFLVGIDLVKETQRLEAAYNDQAGCTSAFLLNLFARMNRELGSRVPLDAVEHLAFYNPHLEQMEIYARFKRPVEIDLPLIKRRFALRAGERILLEISRKFRLQQVAEQLQSFGFSLERTDSDSQVPFAVLLFRRGADHHQ